MNHSMREKMNRPEQKEEKRQTCIQRDKHFENTMFTGLVTWAQFSALEINW